MSKLHADLIDYVKNCRVPMSKFEMAGELELLGAATKGAAWPRATANEWKRAIENAINQGELVEIEGAVRLPPDEADKPAQLSLF